MVFSLFGFASAAEYPDDNEIQYKEAVAVLSGLGIVNGKDTGFEPKDSLTRAEAAKMVAYLIKTPDIAAQLPVDSTKFVDVTAVHDWANPSIVLLEHEGIINGKSADTFAPNDKVTGYELAKMLLVAIGFGRQGEYIGDGWNLRVAADALREGIFDGDTDGKYNEVLTREEAALYIFNALFVDRVHLCKHDRYAVNEVECDCGLHFEDVGPFAVIYELDRDFDTDCYGRPAYVWTSFGDVIAYLPIAPVASYTRAVSADELYDLLGAEAVILADDTDESDSFVNLAADYANGILQNLKGGDDNASLLVGDIDVAEFANGFDADDEEEFYIGGQGVTTEIYEMDEDVYCVIQIMPQLMVVTDIEEVPADRAEGAHVNYTFDFVDENGEPVNDVIEVTDYTTVVRPSQDRDSVSLTAPVKVGDYVMAYGPATQRCPLMVSPANVIEGTVTKYTNKDFTYIVDGKTYPMSAAGGSVMVADEDFNIERLYIIDTMGNLVLGLDKPAPATEFVYVLGARTAEVLNDKNEMTSVAKATIVTLDGEVMELDVLQLVEDGLVSLTNIDEDDHDANEVAAQIVADINKYTEANDIVSHAFLAAAIVRDDVIVALDPVAVDNSLDNEAFGASFVPGSIVLQNVERVENGVPALYRGDKNVYANKLTKFYNVTAYDVATDEYLEENVVVESFDGMDDVPTMLSPIESGYGIDYDGDEIAEVVFMLNAVEKVSVDNVFVIDARDEYGVHDYMGGTIATYDVIVKGEKTTMDLFDRAGERVPTGFYDVINNVALATGETSEFAPAGDFTGAWEGPMFRNLQNLQYVEGVLRGSINGADVDVIDPTARIEADVPVYVIDSAHGTCETISASELDGTQGSEQVVVVMSGRDYAEIYIIA